MNFFFLYKYTGFPIEKGRLSISLPTCPEVQCQTINFRPYAFYPDKPIQVQANVNHFNTSSKNFVHDPAVVWTENITYNGFDVCITGVGRGDRLARRTAAVDWLAYQGAPDGGLAGTKRIRQWWTGTQCENIGLPSVSNSFFMCYLTVQGPCSHDQSLQKLAFFLAADNLTF